ncbi:unnamed protein product [Echinostoma caproni]|uniref:Uncharacterized protein n=1 Tax=Echinostoma caproni TaxID=27848 RepID=A0A3P8KXP4_9TREM|nr:unnamed protein product [Echinostoma caproni]
MSCFQYLRVVRSRLGRFPVVFERVVRVFGKSVSPTAYSFITYIQVNLMGNVKLAVSRDFRINQATVQAQLERSASLSVSSDSEAAEDEVLQTDDGAQEPIPSPILPHSPHTGVDVDEANDDDDSDNLHSVLKSENPVDLGKPVDSENLAPHPSSASTQAQTPAWGRALHPDATRRSLLKRPTSIPTHNVVINKSRRLGPRN